ncbi:DUF3306 domain-containing protein [uncultured Roseovarius sp.]|uniref:DUF3306 domain-containing protein n=1 Tax=uncultured Roseovarius sp. TaxID=293344 RepID=UPI00261AF42C|nr:DUF3306 domain-containing protein [uncultured Roseovarius sp.]
MSEARDFWSRRKAKVAAEVEAEEAAVEAHAITTEQAEKSDEEILADLGLPDPDTMGEGDDFSGFMARAVPDRIRLRALRKLWLTNPVLANVDGLVDYGEDFTDAACVIENLQSAYQVGKGMTAHVEEMARQAELEAAGEDVPEMEEAAPEEPVSTEEELLAEDMAGPTPEDELATYVPPAEEEPAPAPRRRMQFSFETREVVDA